MPVRIYDISKKLGLENKEVLAKAKELGITAARVASSSLDKITAEYLEDQLKQAHPELSTPPSAQPSAQPVEAHAAAPSSVTEPIAIVAIAPAEAPVAEIERTTVVTGTTVLEPEQLAATTSTPPIRIGTNGPTTTQVPP